MNNRLARLEKAIRPKTKRNPLKIVTRPFKDEDVADAESIMIMGRPGTRDTSPDVLYIDVIETRKGTHGHEPEPSDEELPGAIAELEARLKQSQGKFASPCKEQK